MDAAPAFQNLYVKSCSQDSLLKKYNIKIEIGRVLNKNKNPTAENANQEFQREILKFTGRTGPICDLELSMILRNINSRIRHTGYTAKEVFFRRDLLNNTPLQVTDETISEKIKENRQQYSLTSP